MCPSIDINAVGPDTAVRRYILTAIDQKARAVRYLRYINRNRIVRNQRKAGSTVRRIVRIIRTPYTAALCAVTIMCNTETAEISKIAAAV